MADKTPNRFGSAARRGDMSTVECRSQPVGGGWPERPEVGRVASFTSRLYPEVRGKVARGERKSELG